MGALVRPDAVQVARAQLAGGAASLRSCRADFLPILSGKPADQVYSGALQAVPDDGTRLAAPADTGRIGTP
jgi:hypothetical protein